MWECAECDKNSRKEFGKCWSDHEIMDNMFLEKGCKRTVMYTGSYL